MVLSNQVIAQFARESSWATPAAALYLLPFTTFDPSPRDVAIPDEANRGQAAADFAEYAGVGNVELEIGGPWYPEECGFWPVAILGANSPSGAAPTTHTSTLSSSVPSFSWEDKDPSQAYVYKGCQMSALTFRFNRAEGLLNYTARFVGQRAATVSAASLSDATLAPYRGWHPSFSVAGSPSQTLISAEITLERPQEPMFATNNSQDMTRLDPGKLRVTGSLTVDSSINWLAKYLANTREAMVLDFTYGVGANLKQLTLTMTDVSYIREPITRDLGNVAKRNTIAIRGIHNATDGGPIKIVQKVTKSVYTS